VNHKYTLTEEQAQYLMNHYTEHSDEYFAEQYDVSPDCISEFRKRRGLVKAINGKKLYPQSHHTGRQRWNT
jgi:predicted DNA-binding protein YlxM (UPF0122 family)